MLIRRATTADLGHVAELMVDDPVGSVGADRFRQELAAGRFRAEWTWLALDGARIVARALWWGRQDSDRPLTLDCLHVLADVPDRAALAAALLSRAHDELGATPEYLLALPTDERRRHADVVGAVAWRAEAAGAAGLTDVVERLRYEWTPASGLPSPSGRLTFRPADDGEFLAALRSVATGSLDIATRRDLQLMDADQQAAADLDFYRSCPGERSWWRLAETADGDLVGLAIPSATPYDRNVGYLGVVPEWRGHGYVDDILAEITRLHAADGVERITATTDASNLPMAAAFDRAGYTVTEFRMIFAAPAA